VDEQPLELSGSTIGKFVGYPAAWPQQPTVEVGRIDLHTTACDEEQIG